MIKVTVWNEFYHEKAEEAVKAIYPEGIHKQIASFLNEEEQLQVRTATLEEPECGLSEEILRNTDVLIWWGHVRHDAVPDEVAVRVVEEVQKGMGIIFLHSAHMSKPFRLLMGTPCTLGWREDGDYENLWVCNPAHPITRGIGRYIHLEHEETYCEPFAIPEPEQLVFIGAYEGGEAFRAGCCYQRGNGKVFYFQPGHESFPVYYQAEVQTVIKNAVYWADGNQRLGELNCPNIKRMK